MNFWLPVLKFSSWSVKLPGLGVFLGATAACCLAQEPNSESRGLIDLEIYSIVTTGTRTERLATDLPVRTDVLSPDLFDAAGVRDVGAALEYLPGVRAEANCQNCGSAEIKMLGLGSGYNRLLFDGQPLFSGLAAVYGIEQIPTAFIERIEVVKGGASSLYGPGAVAGVINILPREPVINHQHYDFSYESVDGEPFFSSSLLGEWVSGDNEFASSLYGQFNDSASVDLNGDGFSDITEKGKETIRVARLCAMKPITIVE